MLLECRPKRGFLCHGLGFRINALVSDLGVLGPGRDQPPAKHDECACSGVWFNPYGRNVLRWSDVLAGLKDRRFIDLDLFGNDFGRSRLRKASTHRYSS